MTGQPHVLVVEDDALVAQVVVEALEGSYRSSHVETAAAALALLSGGGVDLVLLDCSLPGGIDPRLIPMADAAGVPVIFMSGDPDMIVQAGGEHRPSIVKPFSLTTLLDVVDRIIQMTNENQRRG